MAKKKNAPIAPPTHVPVNKPVVVTVESRIDDLEANLAELGGDLSRIVELLVKGDLDSSKFKEILAKRQGPAQ